MKLLSRLILLLAFAVNTVHAPVLAHENPASHHDEHGAISALVAVADHQDDDGSSQDGAGDSLHHHHCPTALDTRVADIALGVMGGKAILPFHRVTALTSFSQAPPTEPPAA